MQNIQLLQWCKEYGIHPSWNMLWGFPGESPAAYQQMVDLLPLLSHLSPPSAIVRIRVDRFNPNFMQAEALGLCRLEPFPSYAYVYPLPPEAVKHLAWLFRT